MEFSPEIKEDEKNEIPEVRKTFFKTHQEKGYPYFNTTRVGSCSYVLVKNGQCLAVPFYIINRRGLILIILKLFQKNHLQLNQLI